MACLEDVNEIHPISCIILEMCFLTNFPFWWFVHLCECVLMSTMILLLSISIFISVSVCLICWDVPILGASVSSVAQSRPTFCDPMNRSMPRLPVHHQLPELTQTNAHRVGDTIQSSHPLSFPSPSALNPSQNQRLFQWVSSSNEMAKVLEFQL